MTPRIQACLNGARPRGFHPRLPLTPEALAADAVACTAAGAVALHIHPRDATGRQSLRPEVIGAAVAAVRRAGLPVSVSTGAWIEADEARQLDYVRSWAALPAEARPDEASVNLLEASAPAVIAALLEAGTGVEAGLATVADADRLLGLGVLGRCRRVLIEVDDMLPEDALRLADAILARLGAGGPERQLHGMDRSAWPLARRAAELGLMLRIGLEDVGEMPDGGAAEGNAALVRAARDVR